MGLRLRLNCSKDEDFDEAVKRYSRAFAASGHPYRRAKFELGKAKHIYREEFLKDEKQRKQTKKKKGRGNVYWINKYDPRVPHARRVITNNYHILEADPIAKNIFPRKNLVAGSKRGRNLSELISPTVQTEKLSPAAVGPFQPRGSYQCHKFKAGKKCEVCKHMKDGVQYITSKHFNTKIGVKGHLQHEPYDQKHKHRWFIYHIQDKHCDKAYIGSSVDIYSRWSSHKSDIIHKRGHKSGLARHHALGCPGETDQEKSHLELTLLDAMDVNEQMLNAAKHKPGPGCTCSLCNKLKNLEDNWILRVGTFFPPHGLNTRDELKEKVRTGGNKKGFIGG